MSESFVDTKRKLYELMDRMHRGGIRPPLIPGVTHAETRTVLAIAHLEVEGVEPRPGSVAEATHATPSALSQTLKTLEKKGLIERHRGGGDYRAVTVHLTEEGRQLHAETKRVRDRHMDEVMDYVGQEDMQHLARILNKVVDFHEAKHTPKDKQACSEGECPCA